MIREIINEVREAIQEAFTYSLHTNSGSFVLFLARGDYDHRFEGDQFAHLEPKPSPYCLDYMLNSYRAETSILDISIEGIRTMISSIRAMMV